MVGRVGVVDRGLAESLPDDPHPATDNPVATATASNIARYLMTHSLSVASHLMVRFPRGDGQGRRSHARPAQPLVS